MQKAKKQKKLLHCEKVLLPNPHTKPISARKERTRPRSAPIPKKAIVPAPNTTKTETPAPFVATVDLWGDNAADEESETLVGSFVLGASQGGTRAFFSTRTLICIYDIILVCALVQVYVWVIRALWHAL